ncbi:lysophospholipid acyltransferase family protein [Selenomonadales bacterium OttesenSCG-928-I06]|nr:lysophospholipid acyltransferase family protein [Selenomonadales bacterium OttesenSCG-928-I06]
MVYKFILFISKIVCILPYGVRKFLGDCLGQLGWLVVPPKRREIAISNIMRCLSLPRQDAKKLAKKSATRFGPMFMEVLYFPKLNKSNISEYVTLEGREYLDEALALGRGAVISTAHTGNWELLGASLAMYGFPLVSVVQKQSSGGADKFINEYRSKAGQHVTYRQGVREMVKLLSEGMIIGLLMDQDIGKAGVFVEFFGQISSTAQGSAALARMKDSPIVPCFITYSGNGKHVVKIHPPVFVNKTKDRDQDIFNTTQELSYIMEKHIREHPGEWFWLHNRWKTKPPQDKNA